MSVASKSRLREVSVILLVSTILLSGLGGANTTQSTDLTAEGGEVAPGYSIEVAFSLTNSGTESRAYILHITPLPPGFAVDRQSSDGGTWHRTETKWLFRRVDPGETVTPSIVLSIPSNVSGKYSVTVIAKTADGIEASASATVTVTESAPTTTPRESTSTPTSSRVDTDTQTRTPVPTTSASVTGTETPEREDTELPGDRTTSTDSSLDGFGLPIPGFGVLTPILTLVVIVYISHRRDDERDRPERR